MVFLSLNSLRTLRAGFRRGTPEVREAPSARPAHTLLIVWALAALPGAVSLSTATL